MALFQARNFKTQLLVDVSILLGGLALVSIFIVYLANNIHGRSLAIREARVDLATRRAVIESLAELKKGAEEAQPYANLLLNILPLKDALVNFPRDMQDLARRANVEFGSAFGTEVAPNEGVPGSIEFTFTIGGTYARLIDFMRSAETGRYILDWKLFDVALREGVYRGTVTGRVFYR